MLLSRQVWHEYGFVERLDGRAVLPRNHGHPERNAPRRCSRQSNVLGWWVQGVNVAWIGVRRVGLVQPDLFHTPINLS